MDAENKIDLADEEVAVNKGTVTRKLIAQLRTRPALSAFVLGNLVPAFPDCLEFVDLIGRSDVLYHEALSGIRRWNNYSYRHY